MGQFLYMKTYCHINSDKTDRELATQVIGCFGLFD